MRRTYLGEFEEVILMMVAILDGEVTAFCVPSPTKK